jgi:hypothetical protein
MYYFRSKSADIIWVSDLYLIFVIECILVYKNMEDFLQTVSSICGYFGEFQLWSCIAELCESDFICVSVWRSRVKIWYSEQ